MKARRLSNKRFMSSQKLTMATRVLLFTLAATFGSTRATAQTFTTLYSFTDGADGAEPSASLVLSGNTLYGTAEYGGAHGSGTVFAVSTDGTGFTTLHSFSQVYQGQLGAETNSDGANPVAGLVPAANNILYGTTEWAGTNGFGTVFAINTTGTGFATLLNFPLNELDGAEPLAGLVFSGDMLYGTAQYGGENTAATARCSPLTLTARDLPRFTLSATATERCHSPTWFCLATRSTGRQNRAGMGGRVFVVNTDGTGFTTLHSFGGNDGGAPAAGLVLFTFHSVPTDRPNAFCHASDVRMSAKL
jgi:uncharacterized repeat protein (TIGR03803 family)